jgi:5'-deoxynucleotidase YfbR-like HD superfamily hydrolase
MKNKLKPVIHLLNGGYFDFTNPENSIFGIKDIARGLSNIARFSGHTETPYSVAHHSVLVSQTVPEEYAMQALLHDAVEAFIGDVSKPLKNLLPDYMEIEARCESAILRKFNLPYPLDKSVKIADTICFVTELRDLQPLAPLDKIYKNITPLPEKIVPWSSTKAYNEFLKRYKKLGGAV